MAAFHEHNQDRFHWTEKALSKEMQALELNSATPKNSFSFQFLNQSPLFFLASAI